MNIKNIAMVKPVKMFCLEDNSMYLNEKGLLLVEYEDDTRRYLDLAGNVDITDYEEWKPLISKDTKMEYIFKGDTEYYE